VQEWLQKANIDVRHRGIVADCVHRVARESNYHPVRNYLAALRWDEAPRLRSVLQTHFNATGSSDYLEAVGTKFFISAAARIQSPGCQVDHVLVLEGPQGTGKTSSTRVLAGEWVADGLPNLHDKDAAMHLQGVWIVELPELTAIRRTTDLEATKAFLSRTTDRIRPPYGRHMVEMKRQCVFIATTNQAQYLRDRTGNRRFWPVKCGAIDLQALIRDRDQLWAEAFALYQAGQAWHLTPAEAASARDQQAARVFVSELEQCVSMYLDGLVDSGTTQTTVGDVFRFGVHLDPDDKGFMELAGKHGPTVVEIMTTLGWHRVGAIGRGKKRRVIYHFAPETHRGS
jgi:predicted P-loop ATPase